MPKLHTVMMIVAPQGHIHSFGDYLITYIITAAFLFFRYLFAIYHMNAETFLDGG